MLNMRHIDQIHLGQKCCNLTHIRQLIAKRFKLIHYLHNFSYFIHNMCEFISAIYINISANAYPHICEHKTGHNLLNIDES